MPITVPTYDEHQFLLDRIDADERALADLQATVADQVGRLTAQVVVLEAAAVDDRERLADLTESVFRLRRRVSALEGDPPPPVATMAVGTSLHRESGETHQDAYDRRTRNWGAAPEVVRYFESGAVLPSWPIFGDADVVVSFKGHPDDVLAGKYDGHYRNLFPLIPAGTRWSYWHEPENDTFSPGKWGRAFAHIAAIADESDAGRAAMRGPILMGWTVNPASGRDYRHYLPPTRLDYIGWDLYPGPTEDDTRKKYGQCADATKAAGVDSWIICETGLENPSSRTPATVAAWIPLATGIARELGCDAWCYFDSTVGGDFRLTDPVEWAAIGAEIVR